MKFVLKSILTQRSTKQLLEYVQQFAPSLKGRTPLADELVEMLHEFYVRYQLIPSAEQVNDKLRAAGRDAEISYLRDCFAEDVPFYQDDASFMLALESFERQEYMGDLHRSWHASALDFQKAVSSPNPTAFPEAIDRHLQQLHGIKNRLNRIESSTSSLLWGKGDEFGTGRTIEQIYRDNQIERDNRNASYYDLGFTALDRALRFSDGDLLLFMAYTSQGKSIWLRYVAYRQAVLFGRNTAFFSLEMSHDRVKPLFTLLHANNKDIFPGTPLVSSAAYKDGKLTPEQEDFLFRVVDHDLHTNSKYGTIYIDQPNRTKWRMSDLESQVMAVETVLPIHTLVVDYLTRMHPLEGDRGQASSSDMNDMIARFKSILLNHRDAAGRKAPLFGVSAVQASREGYNQCLKSEEKYDLSAIYMYSEAEKSADQVVSSLLTPEMRNGGKIKVQNLKNRDGEVIIDPIELSIDLIHGFNLSEVSQQTAEQRRDILRNLPI